MYFVLDYIIYFVLFALDEAKQALFFENLNTSLAKADP